MANKDALLYDDEWQEVLKKYPNNFKVDYALSREEVRACLSLVEGVGGVIHGCSGGMGGWVGREGVGESCMRGGPPPRILNASIPNNPTTTLQTNKKGGKMYIQDKMEEYADDIFDRLAKVRRER